MNIYRLMLRESGTLADGEKYEAPQSAKFRNVDVGPTPIYVRTEDELDLDELYDEQHIAAKKVAEPLPGFDVTDLSKE